MAPAVASESGEDAYPAWAHEESDDDEHDAPQQLTPEEGDDPGDHEDHGENPEQKFHGHRLPRVFITKPRP